MIRSYSLLSIILAQFFHTMPFLLNPKNQKGAISFRDSISSSIAISETDQPNKAVKTAVLQLILFVCSFYCEEEERFELSVGY